MLSCAQAQGGPSSEPVTEAVTPSTIPGLPEHFASRQPFPADFFSSAAAPVDDLSDLLPEHEVQDLRAAMAVQRLLPQMGSIALGPDLADLAPAPPPAPSLMFM
jgi:hypothetical protein